GDGEDDRRRGDPVAAVAARRAVRDLRRTGRVLRSRAAAAGVHAGRFRAGARPRRHRREVRSARTARADDRRVAVRAARLRVARGHRSPQHPAVRRGAVPAAGAAPPRRERASAVRHVRLRAPRSVGAGAARRADRVDAASGVCDEVSSEESVTQALAKSVADRMRAADAATRRFHRRGAGWMTALVVGLAAACSAAGAWGSLAIVGIAFVPLWLFVVYRILKLPGPHLVERAITRPDSISSLIKLVTSRSKIL